MPVERRLGSAALSRLLPMPRPSDDAPEQHRSPPEELEPREREQADEEEKVNASVTHEVIRREGLKELERPAAALAWSAFAAGLAMGLSLLTQAVLHHHLPESEWRPLVTAIGYAVGFLVVILGSQQLFTENTLTPIVPLMSHWSTTMLRRVLVLWGVVLAANLVGTAVFALAAARSPALSPELRDAARTLALTATSHAPREVFSTGVLAGFIIALMVWMLPAASGSEPFVILAMSWLVGAAGLSHVIVGAVDAFFLVWTGDRSLADAIGGYILPALAGNTLGGVALVAGINHAQVRSS